jgi:hypothetical protein
MDRLNARGLAYPAAAELPSSGWDPHAVWRERVEGPRRLGLAGEPPAITVSDTSAGWDPLEIWRLRVRRPRRAAK